MDFTSKINYILENQYSGDKKKMSENTGIPYSTLVEYLAGKKQDPKLSLLSKIKNVNAFWLLGIDTKVSELNDVEKKQSIFQVLEQYQGVINNDDYDMIITEIQVLLSYKTAYEKAKESYKPKGFL